MSMSLTLALVIAFVAVLASAYGTLVLARRAARAERCAHCSRRIWRTSRRVEFRQAWGDELVREAFTHERCVAGYLSGGGAAWLRALCEALSRPEATVTVERDR